MKRLSADVLRVYGKFISQDYQRPSAGTFGLPRGHAFDCLDCVAIDNGNT